MSRTVGVLIAVVAACAVIADVSEHHIHSRVWFLGACGIAVIMALVVVFTHWGFYGLLTLIGTRLAKFGQERGQKLADKRAAQQRARVDELRALAIVEIEQ